MKRDTPRANDGAKLCAWCGGEIKQSGVGRSRDYCSRTHREYAYRARREAEMKLVAYSRGRADAVRPVSSTVDTRRSPVPTVDETRAPVPPPAAADPGEGWVRSIDEVDAQLRELEARQAAPRLAPAPAPASQKRRRLAPPSTAEAPTLFGPEAADGA
ncbi:hypothetical protein OG416_39235 (plasmid) [Streptomyces longwoodensis]|uniref:hypothetical protein n=1 Tax=Streptomyces longwoodensis TaxID=68231 RepID=UPI002F90CA1F|nr:hypothetical protein OG416_39235 [Streptomyces longwoodensis]